MRVIVNPGTYRAEEKRLAHVVEVDDYMVDPDDVRQVFNYAKRVAEQNAALIELLADKGILELPDMGVFEVPHMEKSE